MAQRVAGAAGSRTNRRFLIVAILLAGLSAALVYAKISTNDGTSSETAVAGDQPVVVAKVAIKQRTQLSADMLQVKNVPANSVALGAITSLQDAIGKVTKYPIEVNQQVLSSAVIDTTKPAATGALTGVIPAGQRAVAISASPINNAGGLILPGDWIDIVWTCCSGRDVMTKTLLKNVQVAAVAQTVISSGPVAGKTPAASGENPVAADPGKEQPDASTITVLLSPEQIQQVGLAEGNGKFRYALRGIGDTDLPDVQPTRLTDILKPEDLAPLPDTLKPEGFKRGQN